MDLVGAWMRQILGAGTAAALVPVAIVAVLVVVIAGAGGLGGLGSLGQLVTGPEVSPARSAAEADRGERERDVALVAPPTLVAAVRPSEAARPSPGGATPERAPRAVVTPPVSEGGRPPEPPPLPPPPPPPPVAAPPPAAPVAPTPRERTKALVDQLGGAVGAVGTVVEEVVEGVGETVEGVLEGPPPGR